MGQLLVWVFQTDKNLTNVFKCLDSLTHIEISEVHPKLT